MNELKEKTFTEGRENALEERDREEQYNPNRETPEGIGWKNANLD